MRRFILLGMIVCVGGCGLLLGGVPNLRSVAFRECRELGLSDPVIELLFDAVEHSRSLGFSQTEIAVAEIRACGESAVPFPCIDCVVSIIDAVFE